MWGDVLYEPLRPEIKAPPKLTSALDDINFYPRRCVGYVAIWHSDQPAFGELSSTERGDYVAPTAPIPFLNQHVEGDRLGEGTVEIDNVGLFFVGKFSAMAWNARVAYGKLLNSNEYVGFSTSSYQAGFWERAGDKYRGISYDTRIVEVSLHKNPLFARTYAVLCHERDIGIVRKILKLRLRHNLGHVARSDWKKLGKLAAITMRCIELKRWARTNSTRSRGCGSAHYRVPASRGRRAISAPVAVY